MKLTTTANKLALFLSTLGCAPSAFAWGERGHHLICEVATRLVKEPGLNRYLEGRGHMMGHLCNIPDISWRQLAPELTKEGDATHFLDPEHLNVSLANLPLDYAKIMSRYDGKESKVLRRPLEVKYDLGSLWWRADQFFRRALAAGKTIPKPKLNGAQGPDYENAVFDMTVAMGVMGHFVGDVSMPYHSTADYDGWASGRGGIHGYYETECVNAMGMDLAKKVFEAAHPLRVVDDAPKRRHSVVERMRGLALAAAPEKAEIEKLDKTFRSSKIDSVAGQAPTRLKAVRPAAAEQSKFFEPLIVREMARSAAKLAEFWDEIYVESGRPDLSAYRSYRYPLDPEFVMPDYTGAKK